MYGKAEETFLSARVTNTNLINIFSIFSLDRRDLKERTWIKIIASAASFHTLPLLSKAIEKLFGSTGVGVAVIQYTILPAWDLRANRSSKSNCHYFNEISPKEGNRSEAVPIYREAD